MLVSTLMYSLTDIRVMTVSDKYKNFTHRTVNHINEYVNGTRTHSGH